MNWEEVAVRVITALLVLFTTGVVGFIGHQIAYVWCQTRKNARDLNELFAKLRKEGVISNGDSKHRAKRS